MTPLIKCENCSYFHKHDNDDEGFCELKNMRTEAKVFCTHGKPLSSDVITDGLKHDGGKPMLALVPSAIIRAVGRVMTHGAEKYGKNSYRDVDPERYRHALMRHICEWLDDPYGVDKDSGLPHLEHIACNVAFLLELDKEKKNEG